MSIRQKLILSFMLISLLGASLGAIAIWSNQKLIGQLAFKEKPTRAAIDIANNISTQAKWAERYLYQFLTLHDPVNRDKFFQHMAAANDHIIFLENNSQQLEGKSLTASIKSQNGLLLAKGEELLVHYDQATKLGGVFSSEKYQEDIFDIHDITNHIRNKSEKLSNLLTDILNRQIEHTAANNVGHSAEEAEAHLMLYLMLDDSMSRDLFYTDVKSISENIDILNRHANNDRGKQILNEMTRNKDELLKTGKLLLAKYKKSRATFSVEKNHQEMTAFHNAASILRDYGVELEKIKIQMEKQPRQNILHKARVFNYTAFTIISGVFFLSIILGFWLAIGLSRSSKRLQLAAKQVGKGNLDAVVDIKSKDEMGVLASVFNQMIGDLKRAYQKLDDRNKVLNEEIIKRKKIEKDLQEQATTDPLTGILNRRAFFDKAQREQQRTYRYQRKLSVLMLDLDYFKSINDNYGHLGGDEILKIFAKEAEKPLRTSDLIGRVGGEEFAVILPETDLQRAVKIAERIRLRVQDISVPIGQLEIHFTVSIGVSEMMPEETDINSALNRADKALYRAKETGRNRVGMEPNKPIAKQINLVKG